jgi:hypothetical protein
MLGLTERNPGPAMLVVGSFASGKKHKKHDCNQRVDPDDVKPVNHIIGTKATGDRANLVVYNVSDRTQKNIHKKTAAHRRGDLAVPLELLAFFGNRNQKHGAVL